MPELLVAALIWHLRRRRGKSTHLEYSSDPERQWSNLVSIEDLSVDPEAVDCYSSQIVGGMHKYQLGLSKTIEQTLQDPEYARRLRAHVLRNLSEREFLNHPEAWDDFLAYVRDLISATEAPTFESIEEEVGAEDQTASQEVTASV